MKHNTKQQPLVRKNLLFKQLTRMIDVKDTADEPLKKQMPKKATLSKEESIKRYFRRDKPLHSVRSRDSRPLKYDF